MNKVIYDGGKTKLKEYRDHQARMEFEFDTLALDPGAIVLFGDEYYFYTWDVQEIGMRFVKMSKTDIKRAMKDGRIQ